MPSPAPAIPTGSEIPLFFERVDRPMYAVLHAPARERPGAPVVVYCPSLGVEHLINYRNQVLAARAAAELGYPVFRYHARGHGDSAGDFADVTLERLVEDAHAAADEARERSGASRVLWLAARFGALVAASAMRTRDDSAGLALWEPVERAGDYFRAQLRGVLFSQVVHGERPKATVDEMLAAVDREGRVDVHGYYLHRALVESARDVELAPLLEPWRGPTLMVQIQSRPRLAPAHAALVTALERRGAPVRTALVAEEPGWHFLSNPAWVSAPLLAATREWLDAVA